MPTDMQLLDADLQLAWRRFRGHATAEQMLSWLNHNFQREYDRPTFQACLEKFRSSLKIQSVTPK